MGSEPSARQAVRNLREGHGGYEEGTRYSVYLPAEVIDVLRWHVDTQLSGTQERSDLLFPSETGGFRAASALKEPFRDVVDAMGLDYPLTPRGMRRTFQDLARAAQVQDLVTRSVSGHASSEMQRHYSTVNPSEQRESLTRVLRVIQGGASAASERSGETGSASGEKRGATASGTS